MMRYILSYFFLMTAVANAVTGTDSAYQVSYSDSQISELEYILPAIQIAGLADPIIFIETFNTGEANPLETWHHKGAGRLVIERESAIEGNALKIVRSTDGWTRILSQPIAVLPNKSYKLCFYMDKAEKIQSQVIISAGSRLLQVDVYEVEQENGWNYYESFFRTADEASIQINLTFSNSAGDVRIDQIVLYETEKMANVPWQASPDYRQSISSLHNMNFSLNY